MEAAIREFEVEIAHLRGVLSVLNMWPVDNHGGQHRPAPLPEYVG